jgi:hypothetical protein
MAFTGGFAAVNHGIFFIARPKHAIGYELAHAWPKTVF